VAKIQNEKKQVTDEVQQETVHRDALAREQTEAEQKRHDIDHQTRLFDNAKENQRLDRDHSRRQASEQYARKLD
jgi:hypothetical protein